jgi:Cu/Ag efflux protein CusF
MKPFTKIAFLLLAGSVAFAADADPGIVVGTVKKIDSKAKTVVIRTAEGTEQVLEFAATTTVHGTEIAAKDSWNGLKEGSEVVAQYSTDKGKKVATEIDGVGKDGLKMAQGTVVRAEKGAKTVVIKSADGVEQAYDTTTDAAAAAGQQVAAGAGKTGKVTVYYTEKAGKKIAHIFRR